MITYALVVILTLVAMLLGLGVRVVSSSSGARLPVRAGAEETRGPGLAPIVPVIDRLKKVNLQIVTMPVPVQDGITRDNVTVRVDAVSTSV